MFHPNQNTVDGGNTSNAAQQLQHPQTGGTDSSILPITNSNVSGGSGQAIQDLAQSRHSNLLSQRTQDLRRSHQAENPPLQPVRPQIPRNLAGENPTLTGPDDYYHIPHNYDVLLDHNPNNPYRPPSPPLGPETNSLSRPAQAHDLYWCLELNGEYSRQTLSTIMRDRQPGFWRRQPEPGACPYFVRVRPSRAGEKP